MFFHEHYPTRRRGRVIDRVVPSDKVSRRPRLLYSQPKAGHPNREAKVSLPASRRQGARVDGMASTCELSDEPSSRKTSQRMLTGLSQNGNAAGTGAVVSPVVDTGYISARQSAGMNSTLPADRGGLNQSCQSSGTR